MKKACFIGTSRNVAIALFVFSSGSALAGVHYVDAKSTHATPPYTNWATAATGIQDAVEAAVAGEEIVVTNGTYTTVGVYKPLSVRSVNGPQFTTIDGVNSLRCADLIDSANLTGFTLTNGQSYVEAGGAYGGTLNNCTLADNRVDTTSVNPAFGGGAAYCTLNNCTLAHNTACNQLWTYGGYGGGAYECTLNNCTLTDNRAIDDYAYGADGGGAYECTLNNCTLTGNWVYGYDTPGDGGAAGCTLNNCIVLDSASSSTLNYCWTFDPLFADRASGNLRLQSNSPCINAGNNSYATNATDLDGNPRIVGGTVDIGAYEFQSSVSMISYAWLQQFNLPINAATETADPDGDGVDNYHEWLAGTDPTNRLSSPAQLTIISSGTNVILTWPTNAVGFTLQSTTNLGSAAVWSTNFPAPVVIGGQNTVTNPITGVQQFYRLVH